MPLRAIARLIQTMLYAQRFFPYYVYNILGGIEEDGESSLLFPGLAAALLCLVGCMIGWLVGWLRHPRRTSSSRSRRA